MASLITETLKTQDGVAITGPVSIRPTRGLKVHAADIYASTALQVNVTAGAFSVSLVPDTYTIVIPGEADATFTVPEGGAPYQLHELLLETGQEIVPGTQYLFAAPQSFTAQQQRTIQYNSNLAGSDDVPGVPWLASRGELVVCGCTLTPASGTAWGMSGAVDAHLSVGFVNMGNQGRLTNSGVIKAVRFYVPSTLPADCEIHVDIWREVATGVWRLVGTTGDLRGSVTANGTVQTVTLSTQIRGCEIGDHVGGHLVYTDGSWGAGFHAIATPSGYPDVWSDQDTQWAYSPDISDYAQWDQAATLETKMIPIQCYMDSPSVVLIGDSRGAAFPNVALISANQGWTKERDIAWRLEKLSGFPVCNVSISGHDSGELETRFAADVVARHPALVVILDTLYNDFYASRNKATFLASLTAMINAALADGSKVALAMRFPFNDPAESADDDDRDFQNKTADEWFADIRALCDTYDENDVLLIDLADGLGVNRPQSTEEGYTGANYMADNVWDLDPLYDYGDGLHLTAAGPYQMARIINAGIRNWLRTQSGVSTHQPLVLANAGDADVTMTRPLRSVTVLPYDTELTGNKTVTLPTSANHGDIIRVVRTGLGSYTLDVGGLKTIGSATAAFVEAVWNGTAWKLYGYGTL